MVNFMKKTHHREDTISNSIEKLETALPFAPDASEEPTAPTTPSHASVSPEANGVGSGELPEPSVVAAAAPEPEPFDLGALIEAKRASSHSEEQPTYDPFDVQSLRLTQDFGSAVGVRKRLVFVPICKPSNEWFVRTHPDESYRLPTALLELKKERETYLVAQPLWPELTSEPTFTPRLLVLAVSRQGNPFLWPARLPGPDGRLDPWNQSALEACQMARTEWVRLKSNMQIGAYDISVASFQAEPEWPDLPFQEILRIAFRDRVISDWNHPALRRLRGEI
jgi:hypothetical protein